MTHATKFILATSLSLIVIPGACKTSQDRNSSTAKVRFVGETYIAQPVYVFQASRIVKNNEEKGYPETIMYLEEDESYCLKFDSAPNNFKFDPCPKADENLWNEWRMLFIGRKYTSGDYVYVNSFYENATFPVWGKGGADDICKKASLANTGSPIYQKLMTNPGSYLECSNRSLQGAACCYGLEGPQGCPKLEDRGSYPFLCPFEENGSQNVFEGPGDGMVNSGIFRTFRIKTESGECLIPDKKEEGCQEKLFINSEGEDITPNETNNLKVEPCDESSFEYNWIIVYHRHNAPPTYCSTKLCRYTKDREAKVDYLCVAEKGLGNYTIEAIPKGYWSSPDAYPRL